MDKQAYKQLVADLLIKESILKEKIKELETELYFCHRNNKIEKELDG